MDPAQVRRASRAAALPQGASQGTGVAPCAGAHRQRQADRRAARPGALRAHPGAAKGLARDQSRPRPIDAHAAPLAGRRRQRQDRRRRARCPAGDRERQAGGVHGAHRDPRRAALPQAAAVARRPAGEGGVAVGRTAREAAPGRSRGDRERRGHARRGHPRAFRGRRGDAAPRPRDRRRAASLRRGPAPAPPRQGGRRGAPAHDERHAHPAHPRHELLRGSRRIGHRRAAARAHAGGDAPRAQQAPAARSSSGCGKPCARGGRRTGCVR